jgi:hypothetical protein
VVVGPRCELDALLGQVPGHGHPNQLLAHQLLPLQPPELGAHQERRRADVGGDLKVIERALAKSVQDPLPCACVSQRVPQLVAPGAVRTQPRG